MCGNHFGHTESGQHRHVVEVFPVVPHIDDVMIAVSGLVGAGVQRTQSYAHRGRGRQAGIEGDEHRGQSRHHFAHPR
jgi:hypothetical protein